MGSILVEAVSNEGGCFRFGWIGLSYAVIQYLVILKAKKRRKEAGFGVWGWGGALGNFEKGSRLGLCAISYYSSNYRENGCCSGSPSKTVINTGISHRLPTMAAFW